MKPWFHRFLILNLVTWTGGLCWQSAAQTMPPPAGFADVRYGPYDNDVLDFYQAETQNPAPVLINYHGGGWTGGDKKSFNPLPLLRAGISVMSANYRFTSGTKDATPYPGPMLDAARVVQYVRSKAVEWHIDPQRIALTGDSAGAVNAMWVAYRDDMGSKNAADPVERLSTRVTCVMPVIGPTTLDPKVILARVGGSPNIHPALPMFFGVKNLAELSTPEMQKIVDDASPLTHVSKDDPPTFMRYASPLGGTPFPATTSPNVTIHHPEFGVMLKNKLDALGIENVLQTQGDSSDPQAMWLFLFKHLKPERAKTAK